MPKRKKRNFAELDTFDNIFQPNMDFVYRNDHELKGRWNEICFKNNNPIVIEVGCGKGEYSVALAKKYPEKNFIGIDIKGERLWRGCKTGMEEGIKNLVFLRSKIEFLCSFFIKNEIDEIWITFPDPQLKKQKKRLTSSRFLEIYRKILPDNGKIHLKTDSPDLFQYTSDIVKHNNFDLFYSSDDIYSKELHSEILSIKTHYEKIYLLKNKPITYINFSIPANCTIQEPY